MDKVTFFDVEYANSKNKSICQMGIISENIHDREPYFPELNVYVNPEDDFDSICVKIHGITKTRVENEPTFKQVWTNVEKYFTNSVIIGHNVASADLNALVKSLRRYDLDIPEIYYIDTYELARTYIPRFAIKNYGMESLCEYFDIDIDNAHNAFDDACANSDLFRALVKSFDLDIDTLVKKYNPHETYAFSAYISNPELRKKISELYGIIRGFTIDNAITDKESEYLSEWRKENEKYIDQKEISEIISEIDEVVSDGVVTLDELTHLQKTVKEFIDVAETSTVTLATQILDGILKGIIQDGVISQSEAENLRIWLYDNIYLSGHYPFDSLIGKLEKVLEDDVLTEDEAFDLMNTIHSMLNPIEATRQQIYSVEGKHVCLSGDFDFGKKSNVETVLIQNGAFIDSSVKKTTDILLIGNAGSSAYSNGTYGTKVKRAMELNERGANILIIKEMDYFK